MQAIKNYFQQFVTIEDNELDLFLAQLEYVEIPKKSMVLDEGKVENYLSFLEKGIVRFNIPKLDYDFTFAFAFENNFFSAYDSFLTQKPSHYNIETITDCKLWRISFKQLNFIYDNTKIGHQIGRKIAEHLYRNKMRREISLLEDSAKKRYTDLLKDQPILIQTIPLKYLASYIGVRPQSLSRIRKEISSHLFIAFLVGVVLFCS